MRLIGAILALALLVSSPAAAQSWREYTYPQYSFGVSFPADPVIEAKDYQTADGGMAHRFVKPVATVARAGEQLGEKTVDVGRNPRRLGLKLRREPVDRLNRHRTA